MERRANTLLSELLTICKSSNNSCIRIIHRYGEYIRATGGSASKFNCIQTHRIDDADYSAVLTFFGLDLDPTSEQTKSIEFDGEIVNITPKFTRHLMGATLVLHLAFPLPFTDPSN